MKNYEQFVEESGGQISYKIRNLETGEILYHRTDGPARITVTSSGTLQEWFRYGEKHRTDGPAFVDSDGSQYYYINGKCHREDGPARSSKVANIWMINGKVHRIGAPAILYTNGNYNWLSKGVRHRLDGPAVKRGNSLFYYVNGKFCATDHVYLKAVAHWMSYLELTRNDIESIVGKFRIVEW